MRKAIGTWAEGPFRYGGAKLAELRASAIDVDAAIPKQRHFTNANIGNAAD